MTRIAVAGALANKPGNGGEAWVRLSWVLGLRRLGFDVCFIEQISPGSCVGADGEPARVEDSANLAYFRRVVDRFGLGASSCLVRDDGSRVTGMTEAELREYADTAVVLINLSGHLTHPPLLDRFPTKVYVDLDPGFTQYWHASGQPLGLEAHDHHVTVGTNVGTPGCPIPTGGLAWRAVLPPVVLAQWPAGAGADHDRFTTVGSWRGGYGPVSWEGRTFGLKVHEFRKLVELPARAPGTFEIALDIHPADAADRTLLERHGWHLVDPRQAAADPDDFRGYVSGSGAEFSVAQGIYVETNSGWVSDRTVRYLAAGKPALVQDTGAGRALPTGDGLLTFRTTDEAVAGVHEIRRDYPRHSRAARALAETFFDSDLVLGALLADVGVSR